MDTQPINALGATFLQSLSLAGIDDYPRLIHECADQILGPTTLLATSRSEALTVRMLISKFFSFACDSYMFPRVADRKKFTDTTTKLVDMYNRCVDNSVIIEFQRFDSYEVFVKERPDISFGDTGYIWNSLDLLCGQVAVFTDRITQQSDRWGICDILDQYPERMVIVDTENEDV